MEFENINDHRTHPENFEPIAHVDRWFEGHLGNGSNEDLARQLVLRLKARVQNGQAKPGNGCKHILADNRQVI